MKFPPKIIAGLLAVTLLVVSLVLVLINNHSKQPQIWETFPSNTVAFTVVNKPAGYVEFSRKNLTNTRLEIPTIFEENWAGDTQAVLWVKTAKQNQQVKATVVNDVNEAKKALASSNLAYRVKDNVVFVAEKDSTFESFSGVFEPVDFNENKTGNLITTYAELKNIAPSEVDPNSVLPSQTSDNDAAVLQSATSFVDKKYETKGKIKNYTLKNKPIMDTQSGAELLLEQAPSPSIAVAASSNMSRLVTNYVKLEKVDEVAAAFANIVRQNGLSDTLKTAAGTRAGVYVFNESIPEVALVSEGKNLALMYKLAYAYTSGFVVPQFGGTFQTKLNKNQTGLITASTNEIYELVKDQPGYTNTELYTTLLKGTDHASVVLAANLGQLNQAAKQEGPPEFVSSFLFANLPKEGNFSLWVGAADNDGDAPYEMIYAN